MFNENERSFVGSEISKLSLYNLESMKQFKIKQFYRVERKRLRISVRREKLPVCLAQILNAAGLTKRLAESAAHALTSCQAVTYLSLAGLLHSNF